jgi:Protein of unknown function (DUF3380).
MIQEREYAAAAEALDCEVAAVKAVAQVEGAGSGFLPNGIPKILFEAHVFSRLTGGMYDRSHPNISSPRWNRKLYKGGAAEHTRLKEATDLNREAALQSCSWGAFQIMGENWRACGFYSLQDFINSMYAGEAGQLKAFIGFIKTQSLGQYLKRKDWAKFAERYNGPGYKLNKYDTRLEAAYRSFLN